MIDAAGLYPRAARIVSEGGRCDGCCSRRWLLLIVTPDGRQLCPPCYEGALSSKEVR